MFRHWHQRAMEDKQILTWTWWVHWRLTRMASGSSPLSQTPENMYRSAGHLKPLPLGWSECSKHITWSDQVVSLNPLLALASTQLGNFISWIEVSKGFPNWRVSDNSLLKKIIWWFVCGQTCYIINFKLCSFLNRNSAFIFVSKTRPGTSENDFGLIIFQMYFFKGIVFRILTELEP